LNSEYSTDEDINMTLDDDRKQLALETLLSAQQTPSTPTHKAQDSPQKQRTPKESSDEERKLYRSRSRNPQKWKANENKKKVAAGEAFVNRLGVCTSCSKNPHTQRKMQDEMFSEGQQ
jgi:hypothetical protein